MSFTPDAPVFPRWLSSLAALLLFTAGVGMAAHAAAPAGTAKRTPDWSGVWQSSNGPIWDPTAKLRPENKGFAISELRDFPPYNAEYERRYTTIIENNRRGVITNDPSASCVPIGVPRMMAATWPMEFIIQPNRVVMLFEFAHDVRIVHTDGRKHTPIDEITYTFNGESIGHWEGDTLVVDTIGLRPEPTFDLSGAMHSDEMHIVERIRRTSPKLMEIQMVIEDPKAFTQPWKVTRTLDLKPGDELMELMCEDNNRNRPGFSFTK